ncbi:hypothetical protein B0F90DRAFT_1730716 [Multifurca ochricompacta]|uniref:Uncharacterized protein n=1 Tax=Multifurca ochricompacta TaxID=376703 RepID=A0AAD4QJW2_9AGAM|nr:hypothetical protein B0F90DRAFT_1730716 [Multifurca ochricompacta]
MIVEIRAVSWPICSLADGFIKNAEGLRTDRAGDIPHLAPSVLLVVGSPRKKCLQVPPRPR